MENYIHSVILDKEKCKGCTTCIAHCPTEAIRVRKGKAQILTELCIDCGECIRVCPSHAKKAQSDTLDDLKGYDYTVALPAPTLYGQFPNKYSINQILTGLKQLGFDEIYEVAEAAELVADEMARILENKDKNGPLISSSCPAIVRLIQIRFPGLLERVVRLESPMEVAARIIKQERSVGKGRVGVFFITPCPAKVTAVRSPIGSSESQVDGVIPINQLYLPLQNRLKNLAQEEPLSRARSRGILWARSEGESDSLATGNTVTYKNGKRESIAVDGIHNVITLLEELENGKLKHIDFVEAMACPGGCVGGALTVENPYVGKARIQGKMVHDEDSDPPRATGVSLYFDMVLRPKQILKLDTDMAEALKKMSAIEKLEESLPGLDCGACGAPTCRALAEDIVRGQARKNDCVFVLREQIKDLTRDLAELGSWMPPSIDHEPKEE